MHRHAACFHPCGCGLECAALCDRCRLDFCVNDAERARVTRQRAQKKTPLPEFGNGVEVEEEEVLAV